MKKRNAFTYFFLNQKIKEEEIFTFKVTHHIFIYKKKNKNQKIKENFSCINPLNKIENLSSPRKGTRLLFTIDLLVL